MIILIILGIVSLGLIIAVISLRIMVRKDTHTKSIKEQVYGTTLENASMGLAIVLAFVVAGLIIASGFAIATEVGTTKEFAYMRNQMKYEVLMIRIENQKDHVLEDVELYNDIVVYNTTIQKEQKLLDSKWVGIFHDQSIAKCKEIDLSAFSKEVQNGEDKG